MDDSQLLKLLIASISDQTDVLMAMSTAGLTGVYVTFFRLSRPTARLGCLSLAPVAIFFVVALFCGYLMKMLITGYFHEMTHGATGEDRPSDALEYFTDEYSRTLRIFAGVQLIASFLGALWLVSLWLKIYCVERRTAPE